MSSACLRLSSSDSSPSSGGLIWVATGAMVARGGAAGGVPSADVTVQMGPWAHGELKSLAELLDEVKDGDDREDRDEVTVGRHKRQETQFSLSHQDFIELDS